MKKIIRLTESDIHRIISKSVNKVLRENDSKNDYISVRRIISEKHRPSGVSRRIHTRDANGQKQSFDYIPNLPKYNKNQNFRQASKFQRINARPVEDPNGEDIDTVLKDGTIERKGLHLPQGYYNVNNVGGTEHWGIDPKTFAKKYEADPTQQGVYKPKGGPMMASDPTKRNLAFQAPWGGRMDMKKGSRIMQDPNNPRDTYGIGGNEFDSTYKFDENTRRINRIVNESINRMLNEIEVKPKKDDKFGTRKYLDDEYGEYNGKMPKDWITTDTLVRTHNQEPDVSLSRNKRDSEGYDRYGYDIHGIDRNGFNRKGYDSEGYDENGLNKDYLTRDEVEQQRKYWEDFDYFVRLNTNYSGGKELEQEDPDKYFELQREFNDSYNNRNDDYGEGFEYLSNPSSLPDGWQ